MRRGAAHRFKILHTCEFYFFYIAYVFVDNFLGFIHLLKSYNNFKVMLSSALRIETLSNKYSIRVEKFIKSICARGQVPLANKTFLA